MGDISDLVQAFISFIIKHPLFSMKPVGIAASPERDEEARYLETRAAALMPSLGVPHQVRMKEGVS